MNIVILSKKINQNPFDIAEKIANQMILSNNGFFDSIIVAKPGFINFKINANEYSKRMSLIIEAGNNYGQSSIGKGKTALVEFVSANPTGPLTVGHGRGAMLGDTISNILYWNGYKVEREYYYNNAGKQMERVGQSVQARYFELIGQSFDFPNDGYEGDYIIEIAQELKEKEGEKQKPPSKGGNG